MATTQNGGSSCLPSSPFMNLGDGANAPILNYNLPQKTCYNVNAFYPLTIPTEYFASEFITPPAGNPWDVALNMTLEDITTTLRSDILGRSPSVLLQNATLLLKRKDLIKFLSDTGIKYVVQDSKPETYVVGDSTLRVAPVPSESGSNGSSGRSSGSTRINHLTAIPNFPADKIQVAGYTLAYIAAQVANGLIPEMVKLFGGRIVMKFRPKPVSRPVVSIVEHLKLCSFLGDYGAGKTVKTFSLLPGERTTIAVRSYKDKTSSFVKSSSTNTNEYTSTYFAEDESSYAQNSENVLDSYSQHSAEQLQESVSEMSGQSSRDEVQTIANQITESGGGSNFGINLLGLIKFETGGGNQTSMNTSATGNSVRENFMETLSNAMQSHVSESGQFRDVEVNTTTGNSSNQNSGGSSGGSSNISVSQQESMMIKAGEETTTLRELQNINYSRVLNFVFRQMLQEYVTLTYLNDATIQFSTGFPGQNRMVRLSELEGFLEEVIPDLTHRAEVRKIILLHFCNVVNYQGTVMPFTEKVTEIYQDCVDATQIPAIEYWRKKKNLVDTYSAGGLELSVPGIITSVQSYILKTDSVVVDALLGQGEALDCYNMRLQDSAALSSEQRNERYALESRQEDDKVRKALEVISAITDPVAQAEAYKKVFGECCSAEELSVILNAQAPA